MFYLDSGATDHICNTKDFFSKFELKTQQFTVPGGTTTTEGIGTIILHLKNIQTGNEDTLILKEVAYMPQSKNLISTGILNKMNLHVNTEYNILYSATQQKGYQIQEANHLLSLPCVIKTSKFSVLLTPNNNKRKSPEGMLQTATSATREIPQEPEYQEDIKFDTQKFHDVNNKYGPFQVELFANKSNNLLPTFYTRDTDSYSDEWSHRSFYGNPIFKNDEIYRALNKATSVKSKSCGGDNCYRMTCNLLSGIMGKTNSKSTKNIRFQSANVNSKQHMRNRVHSFESPFIDDHFDSEMNKYHVYGDTHFRMKLEHNLPIYIQITDHSNILLYSKIKETCGDLVYRKVDYFSVMNGSKIKEDLNMAG